MFVGFSRRAAQALTVGLAVGSAAFAAQPAAQAGAAHSQVVSAVPGQQTPGVLDGKVLAIAKVGSKIILGGSFTQVRSAGSSTVLSRSHILAFDAATGQVDPGFAPQLNGDVESLAAGADGSVYAAGPFTTVNGAPARVAKLDVSTGRMASGWTTPVLNGRSSAVTVSGSTVYLGGSFTTVNGIARTRIAALSTAGTVQTWFRMGVWGRHGTGTAQGALGPKDIDVAPNGRDMVVIGNFTTAGDPTGSADRDQVVRMTMTPGTSATVRRDWRTLGFTSQCFNSAFDSWVRDVDWAPDGSHFVIGSTGGVGKNVDGTKALCDSVSRFDNASTGSAVQPRWVSYTGLDSIWSVAATGSAVYAGGHQRWMNNGGGTNSAYDGAVPRPGLAALDPVGGAPLAWNPGRNPRGVGATALLATTDGLYVGSDTTYIGNRTYLRERIAYFPLAGGSPVAAQTTAALPSNVYAVRGGSLVRRTGSSTGAFGTKAAVDYRTLPWSDIKCIFKVGDDVYYLTSQGGLHRRSFNGTTFGPDERVDPYNDPVWSTVDTGSGQTYRGKEPTVLNGATRYTSAFYANGRLYYTVYGYKMMYYRAFSPDSGALEGQSHPVYDNVTWTDNGGAFLSGNKLYVASRTDGRLRAWTWDGTKVVGSPTLVGTANDWNSLGMFLAG